MGKESQLLEAAAAGNNTKVENILKGRTNALKRWLSREKLEDIDENDSPETNGASENVSWKRKGSMQAIMHRQLSQFVNVNCTDENGSTPLILASLNGHRAVADTLLQFSANVKAKDKQGNTALHMAAWQNRSELVELLLLNGADSTVTNFEGNTPLHYACQYCLPGKTMSIIKLLQHRAGVLVMNKAGDTPLDLAIRYNKIEAVATLVDAEPHSLKSSRFLVDAAKTGRKEVVEILLEAGMDPNSFDTEQGTLPLHEAVTFFRKDVASLLVAFGAQPGVKNGKGKSALDIVDGHPPQKKEEFMKLFKSQHGKQPRVPRSQLENEQEKSITKTDTSLSFAHTRIKNRRCWLKDTAEHRSSATKKHPCSCLLDNDPNSYWLLPSAGAYNWVAFDFGSEYTLTGVRLYGWGNKKMVYTFDIETAPSLSGPWAHVTRYQAEMEGPEEMDQPAVPQDFIGFYAITKCVRLVIADNYGDQVTALSGVEFYGIENVMVELFKKLELVGCVKSLAGKGHNQLSDICVMSEEEMTNLVDYPAHRTRVMSVARKLRPRYYPPANLAWAVKPVDNITEGKILPHFSVSSDPYTVGDLTVIIHGGGEIVGKTTITLRSKDNGYPSRGDFTGLYIKPAGSYVLEIQSATDPSVSLTTDEPICVVPPPKRQSEVDRLFKDFEDMLNF